MPAWTQDELLLFLLFFVPGFISIKVYDLLVPAERRNFQSTLAEAIGYSAVNFAILLPLVVAVAYGYGLLDGLWWQLVTSYVVLLIAPVLWPWLFVRIIRPRFSKVFVNPIPKPWDVVFRQRGESWIIVHLTDGRRVGGRFARGSEASSYPAEEQLYIKEVWRLDENGRFVERVDRTGGIIVSGRTIEAIEFFD
jgi:hypothetical protein